jgi:phosphoribosyl 1,2-cyclic phosphodiesterase
MAVIAGDSTILIDVTRDFATQASALARVDLVLVTHAHRDATGGVGKLDRWLRASAPVPLLSSRSTVRALRARHRRLARLELRGVASGTSMPWGRGQITPLAVPHARDCTTFAWRLDIEGVAIIYASDVARLTPELASLCTGCDLLVLDGAMWRRQIFTHLEIQSTAPIVARWPVRNVLFTQLGRSTPEHAVIERWLRAFDPRFGAAYDGLELQLSASRARPSLAARSAAARPASDARFAAARARTACRSTRGRRA